MPRQFLFERVMNEPTQPPAKCPRCGAMIDTDAPEGLCPRCLSALQIGVETMVDEDGVAVAGAPLSPEELAPHFPQLEIIECLGRGGMGVVYKARQRSLNRLVALKLLAPERADDPRFAEHFAKEAQALASLNHPNIVGVHDFGQAGGFFFLLMEFVDGVNLRQAIKAGRFTPEEALAIVPPVCEALQFAHEHGIVHRDIKPENLLLDKAGRVKIADFGIAKLLGAGGPDISLPHSQPAGTPQYMAPEQKAQRRTDHRADIYSLGVVLYELLTGELPAANLEPPSRHRVQIDVRLDQIVLRALEVKPELRFQTAGEMRTQVEAVISTPGSSRRGKTPTSSAGSSSLGAGPTAGPRRSGFLRGLAIAGLAALVVFGIMVAVWSFLARSTPVVTLSYTPVRSENNVVILNLQAVIVRGPVDVQLTLEGPELPPEQVTVGIRIGGEAAEMIKPGYGNKGRRVRTLKTSVTTWSAAFVLPNESLAKAARENLRPLGPLEIRADRSTAGTLFEVTSSQGETYTAHFIVRSIRSQLEAEVSVPSQRRIPAIVSGQFLDQDRQPLNGAILAFVKDGQAMREAGALITDGPSDANGFFQFELPTDVAWQVILLRNGQEVARSPAMRTPAAGSTTTDAPDYDLELRLDGTQLQASLTPLSLSAVRGIDTSIPQTITRRLELAVLHKELADVRESLGASHPKVLELLKRMEEARRSLSQQ
jgi:serine/threonine protein kinase